MSGSGIESWHDKDIILQQPCMGKQTVLYTHMPFEITVGPVKEDWRKNG